MCRFEDRQNPKYRVFFNYSKILTETKKDYTMEDMTFDSMMEELDELMNEFNTEMDNIIQEAREEFERDHPELEGEELENAFADWVEEELSGFEDIEIEI